MLLFYHLLINFHYLLLLLLFFSLPLLFSFLLLFPFTLAAYAFSACTSLLFSIFSLRFLHVLTSFQNNRTVVSVHLRSRSVRTCVYFSGCGVAKVCIRKHVLYTDFLKFILSKFYFSNINTDSDIALRRTLIEYECYA